MADEPIKLSQQVEKQMEVDSFNELRKCERRAVVANEFFVNEMASNLLRDGRRNVYVGKNKLVENQLGINFKGFLTCNIFYKRVKGAESSGIWNWWNKLVVNHVAKINRHGSLIERNSTESAKDNVGKDEGEIENEFEPAKLLGRIQIVFITWVGGTFLAIIAFFIENFIIWATYLSKVYLENQQERV